jgi:hypothetical protein
VTIVDIDKENNLFNLLNENKRCVICLEEWDIKNKSIQL